MPKKTNPIGHKPLTSRRDDFVSKFAGLTDDKTLIGCMAAFHLLWEHLHGTEQNQFNRSHSLRSLAMLVYLYYLYPQHAKAKDLNDLFLLPRRKVYNFLLSLRNHGLIASPGTKAKKGTGGSEFMLTPAGVEMMRTVFPFDKRSSIRYPKEDLEKLRNRISSSGSRDKTGIDRCRDQD